MKLLPLFLLGAACIASAQDKAAPLPDKPAALPDKPIPRPESRPLKNSNLQRSWLHDKPVLWFMAVQGGAELLDGFGTKHAEHVCPTCSEEPIERLFIGRKPTWARMAPFGVAEAVGAAWLAHRLHRHTRFWWLLQGGLTAYHITSGIHNLRMRGQ